MRQSKEARFYSEKTLALRRRSAPRPLIVSIRRLKFLPSSNDRTTMGALRGTLATVKVPQSADRISIKVGYSIFGAALLSKCFLPSSQRVSHDDDDDDYVRQVGNIVHKLARA
ncbi:hypothetical protein M0802_003084 [Mischocyttarus mexicanus]|nr:hypothetical protein M0802_003084 [Mischocyttarus mexicanus]